MSSGICLYGIFIGILIFDLIYTLSLYFRLREQCLSAFGFGD